MISFIKGTVDSLSLFAAVIESNGVGYEIFVTPGTLSGLKIGEQAKIYTYLQVREDSLTLFGFTGKEELSMFMMLISVSGIGPKSALNILSQASPKDLMINIVSNDIPAMSRLPGIGKKTAGRLILELRDKIKAYDYSGEDFSGGSLLTPMPDDSPRSDAASALMALGYSKSDSIKAVARVQDGESVQQIISQALKGLSSDVKH